MSTEVFEAKSRAKLVELAPQSGASIAGKSGGLRQENQMQTKKAQASEPTRKLSVMLNYVLDLSDYVLDLSDYMWELSK